MPARVWSGIFGLGSLLLAGCAGQSVAVTPQQALGSVQTGQALLTCHEPCLTGWQAVQPQAAELAASRRWAELAALVLRIGYEDDLTVYYLGNAAEGTGSPGAAAGYYRQSIRLSETSAACLRLSRACGGFVLPRAAFLRLAAIERELRRKYGAAPPGARRIAPVPGEPNLPPGEAGPLLPEPVSAAAPAQSPAAPTENLPPSRFPDYIEPPPLGR